MKIILIHKKKPEWNSAEWGSTFAFRKLSCFKANEPRQDVVTFGSRETVHYETCGPLGTTKPARYLVFVHANDTDRWAPADDNLVVSDIEAYGSGVGGSGFLGVLPFTTTAGNARKARIVNGERQDVFDVVYGSKAIGSLLRAVAEGRSFRTIREVQACLDPEMLKSVDAVRALAILCQGFMVVTVAGLQREEFAVKDLKAALDRMGWWEVDSAETLKAESGDLQCRKLFGQWDTDTEFLQAKRDEVRHPKWWKRVFPARPDVGSAGEEVCKLLDAVWPEAGRVEDDVIESSTVASAYLELSKF
jgi:hypothetical protein